MNSIEICDELMGKIKAEFGRVGKQMSNSIEICDELMGKIKAECDSLSEMQQYETRQRPRRMAEWCRGIHQRKSAKKFRIS